MPSVNKRLVGPVFLATVLAVLGAAVYVTDRKPSRIRPDPTASFVWSAAPGIDLGARGSELVRATIESTQIALSVGFDFTYPGFMDARRDIPRGETGVDNGSDSKYELWLEQDRYTYRGHIAKMSSDDARVSAKVCQYKVPGPGDKWSGDEFTGNFRIFELEFENSSPGRDYQGHGAPLGGRRTPEWNAFGSWRISKLDITGESELERECQRWFNSQVSGLKYSHSGYPRLPGIPLGIEDDSLIPHEPIQPQYPKW